MDFRLFKILYGMVVFFWLWGVVNLVFVDELRKIWVYMLWLNGL